MFWLNVLIFVWLHVVVFVINPYEGLCWWNFLYHYMELLYICFHMAHVTAYMYNLAKLVVYIFLVVHVVVFSYKLS